MRSSTTTTKQLAAFVAETSYDDLPASVIEIAKTSILDTVGVTLAGARDETGLTAIDAVKNWKGNPVSVVMGGNFKTSAPDAALANGTCAHALDFDDRSIPINHYNASLIPSVLALGESIGASGKKILESFVLGYEIGARIGTGFGVNYYFRGGWHPANAWAPLGSAAACAKLLDLGTEQIQMALGIASSASGGIRKHYGSNTKPLHCGYAARNGIVAAELSLRGFTADADVLDQSPDARETAHKFFSLPQVFCGAGNFDLEVMTAGLGDKYYLVDSPPEIKFHPGSISTSRFIDLTIEAMKRHAFAGQDVERAQCFVTGSYLDAASPFLRPSCPDEARYSLPYQIAVTLLDGDSWIDQHSETRMSHSDVTDLTARVVCEQITTDDPKSYDMEAFRQMEVPRMVFALKDGREITVESNVEKPGCASSIDSSKVEAKYRDCALRSISEENCAASISMLKELDKLSDVSEYTQLLL